MTNPWDKIFVDDFEAAYRIAKENYSESLQRFDLRAMAISSFLLRNYSRALEHFLKVKDDEQKTTMVSDGTFLEIGLCHYAMDNLTNAIEYFQYPVANPELMKYTIDITVPACILFYIGLRTSRQDLEKLAVKKLKQQKQIVPQFLLGLSSENELHRLYKDETNEILRNRMQCETEFYKAAKSLQEGDDSSFREHIRQCVDLNGTYLEFEYFMARVELDKINNP